MICVRCKTENTHTRAQSSVVCSAGTETLTCSCESCKCISFACCWATACLYWIISEWVLYHLLFLHEAVPYCAMALYIRHNSTSWLLSDFSSLLFPVLSFLFPSLPSLPPCLNPSIRPPIWLRWGAVGRGEESRVERRMERQLEPSQTRRDKLPL